MSYVCSNCVWANQLKPLKLFRMTCSHSPVLGQLVFKACRTLSFLNLIFQIWVSNSKDGDNLLDSWVCFYFTTSLRFCAHHKLERHFYWSLISSWLWTIHPACSPGWHLFSQATPLCSSNTCSLVSLLELTCIVLLSTSHSISFVESSWTESPFQMPA